MQSLTGNFYLLIGIQRQQSLLLSMPWPPGSWTLTKVAWEELTGTVHLQCVLKLRAIMQTLDERTKDQCEKQLSTLQKDTWDDISESLLLWHTKIAEGMDKHGVFSGAGFFIAEQQAMCDYMKDLKNILDIDFEETMVFVNAKSPKKKLFPLPKRPSPTEEQIAEANNSRTRFVTDVKDLPDYAARKAIAGLWKAMTNPEYQRYGSEWLEKANKTKMDDLKAWDVYAKKHWEETYGSYLK